jgi:hypothetical protein
MTTMGRTACAGAALLLLGLMPPPAEAQQRHVRGHGRGHHHVDGRHQFNHRPFGSRVIVVAPFVPFGYGSTSIVDSAPPMYYAPPVVYAPQVAYGPSPAYAAPPPQQPPQLQQDVEPMQREVVFPSGRYVLRGDGINTPYTWVWIPNPPTAPPGAAPSGSRSRDAERVVYSWTDASGVTTWTDRLSQVPPEHRAAARRDF